MNTGDFRLSVQSRVEIVNKIETLVGAPLERVQKSHLIASRRAINLIVAMCIMLLLASGKYTLSLDSLR